MRLVLAFFCFAAVAFAAAESTTAEAELTPKELATMFTQFLTKFKRSYSASTFAKKLATFSANVKKTVSLNAAKLKASFGVTKFADLSTTEFKAYMGARPPSARSFIEAGMTTDVEAEALTEATIESFSTGFDWSSKNLLKDPRYQGGCGSCWSFATARVIEAASAIKGGSNAYVSTQAMVDCANGTPCGGCNGGYITCATDYSKTTGYFSETDKPYASKKNTCDVSKLTPAGKVKSLNMVRATDNDFITGIKASPLFVTVDATPLQLYKAGIITAAANCSSTINHAVVATGFGNADGSNYYNIANSWGKDWGEAGHFRISSGNTCGLFSYPGYYVTLA